MKHIFKNKLLKLLFILSALFLYHSSNFPETFAHPAIQKAEHQQKNKENLNFQEKLLLLKNPFLADSSKPKTQNVPTKVIPVNNTPRLKGIIQNNDQHTAIIEYSGKSDFYITGQSIGPYQITDITAYSVTYSDCNKTYTLRIEGK